MNYKIAFFDMDGTLYQTEHDIIETANIEALQSLKKNGVKVCAATGRPLNQMGLILDKYSDFDYYVLINGGYILDQDQKLLYENPIDDAITQEIVDWSKEYDNGLMFHFGDATYIYSKFYPFYDFCKEHHVLDYLFYDKNRNYHKRHHAYNAVVMAKNEKDIETFVNEHPSLRMEFLEIKDGLYVYDIFNKSNDKSNGIDQILQKEHLSWDDCVCFGDSTNDIKMLEHAGCGVAMMNATDFVKKFADVVTDSVYDQGVANAINKIFIK